jgi:predicted MFS family arabinose efflux permease
MALPFAANAAAFALGAVLVSRVAGSSRERAGEGTGTGLVAEMAEGIRWLLAHPPMRTLALTILTFNVTYGAAWAVLVLYAGDRLAMDEVGFGLLTSAIALSGIIGIISYGAWNSIRSATSAGRLLIETGTHLVLALTTSSTIALATLVVFGAHAFVWGTTSTVVRQRAVPDELLGRVGGVYRVAIVGGLVVGTPLGGLLARQFGITAPFWFGFVGSVFLVAVLWRQFALIAHAGEARRGPGGAAAATSLGWAPTTAVRGVRWRPT